MVEIKLPSDDQYKDWEKKGYAHPDAQFDTSTGLRKKAPGKEVRTPVDITKGIQAEIPKVSAAESGAYSTPLETAAGFFGAKLPEFVTGTEKAVYEFARGFNNVIVGLPDAGINAIMEGLEKVGVVPENERSRDYLMRVFNSGDYETVRTIIPYLLTYGEGEAVGSSGYARGAGQALGAAIPFIGVAGRTAQVARTLPGLITAEKAALTANPTALRILQSAMVNPYVRTPGAAATIEGTFAAISGVGAKAEKDLFGTNTGAGALAPIVAPVVLAKSLGKVWEYSPTRRVASWLNPKDLVARGQDYARKSALDENMQATDRNAEQVKTTVGLEMAAAYNSAEARANAARALELENIILKDSDAFLTTGEKTKDAVQLAKERALAQGGDDSYRIKLLDRRHQIYDAMRKFYHNVVLQGNDPAGTDTPMFIRNTVSGRIEPLLKKVQSDKNEVDNSLVVASAAEGEAALFPSIATGTRAARGATIREAIENLYTAATKRAEDFATKLGLHSSNEVADPTAFRNAQKFFKEEGGFSEKDISYQNLPKSVRQFLQHKESLSFQDWKRFRDQVGDDIGSALAKGQSTAVKSLMQLKSTLDNFGTEYGKINKDFQKFNEYYQQNVVLPFQNNTVASVRVGSGSRLGGGKKIYQISDESVAKHFLGNEESAKSYVRLFGDDATKMEAIRAAALDEIRKNGGIDAAGLLNAPRINNWINRNGDMLRGLNLLDEFTDSSQLLNNLSRRSATLKNREEKITSNLVYKVLLAANKDGDPTKLLDAGLKSPSVMRGLRNTVLTMARRDKDNANAIQEAWNRSVIERFTFNNSVDFAADDGINSFASALKKNERALIAGIGKKQYQNLWVLSDLAARVQSSGKVRLLGEASDSDMIKAMEKAIGLSPQNISRSMLAYKEGRLSGKTLGVYFASRAIGRLQQRRVQELWERALSDPKLANLLTKEGINVGTTEKPVWRPLQSDIKQLNAYLFNLGYPYGDIPGVDPENRPAETITIKPGPQSSIAPASAPAVQTASVEPEQTSAEILKQIVSAPSPASSNASTERGAGTSQMAELFPFDATSAAIERRKTANQIPSGGIQQLVG